MRESTKEQKDGTTRKYSKRYSCFKLNEYRRVSKPFKYTGQKH